MLHIQILFKSNFLLDIETNILHDSLRNIKSVISILMLQSFLYARIAQKYAELYRLFIVLSFQRRLTKLYLIGYILKIFIRNTEIAKEYCIIYRINFKTHIFINEYFDLNNAQYNLTMHLSEVNVIFLNL